MAEESPSEDESGLRDWEFFVGPALTGDDPIKLPLDVGLSIALHQNKEWAWQGVLGILQGAIHSRG